MLNVLGVILDETRTFRQHIEQRVVHSAASSMYALKVLRSRGLSGQQLWDVTTQTLVAHMLYASPVWWGFIDASSRNEIEAVIRRLIRLNYLPSEFGLFEEMCRKVDTTLFSAVLNDSTHVLNHLLPPVKDVGYNLRPRTHDRCPDLGVDSGKSTWVDLDLRSRVKSDSSAAAASFLERNQFYAKSTLKKNWSHILRINTLPNAMTYLTTYFNFQWYLDGSFCPVWKYRIDKLQSANSCHFHRSPHYYYSLSLR